MTHLEFEWRNPIWRPWFERMSRRHTLIRFDPRGCGLSDREVDSISLDAWVRDMEAVVEATRLKRFTLFGASQGGAIAIMYAARHPERVCRLILLGAYARGRLARATSRSDVDEADTLVRIVRMGWGTENPAFRQVFTTLFIPDGSPEHWRAFNELERVSTSGENAARILSVMHQVDVRSAARDIRVPTLVAHARDDARIPFEEGRLLAGLIPNARFVPLDSRNHILVESEPAWEQFMEEVNAFAAPAPGEPTEQDGEARLPDRLTPREREVLDLIARGLGNATIAEQIGITPNTLRNHINSIFDKIRVTTRAEAIVKAREVGLGRGRP
jgi:pimeloyl-ACP methyl ester carboxylesterase/DNA-binding CsgD family transcriptional regulator